MFKKFLILLFFSLTLVGCSSTKIDIPQKEEISKKTTIIGNEEVGFYELEGIYEDISEGHNFLVYKNELGIIVTIKKFDKIFEEKDIEYVNNLTKETLTNTGKKNIIINNIPFIMAGGLAEGNIVRSSGEIEGLIYNMDVYMFNTKNNETIYLSIEGFEQMYDIKKYTKYLMDDFFISEL